MHIFDDVFLNDTTTRRIVLADSIGPLVTARSPSAHVPGVAARRRHRHSFGGPPACADAGKRQALQPQ